MAAAEPSIGLPAVFFDAHRERLRAAAPLGPILDLACGRGRHALAAAEMGLEVLAVDRNPESLAVLEAAAPAGARLTTRVLDLETGTLPSLPEAPFGAVLVFRYLHRPLMPWIASQLAPGGVLLYETFTIHQRALGWGPSRSEFLLDPGELPGLFPGLEVLAYEEGENADAKPAQTARLLARRPDDPS